jgi:prephenate dehydratase
MKLPNVSKKSIDTIMAHPQVLKQCKNNLGKKYTNLHQKSGTSNLIDTAAAAQALNEGKLPASTAILGPKVLSNLYNLEIIDSNLQDDPNNVTSFLIVKRRISK